MAAPTNITPVADAVSQVTGEMVLKFLVVAETIANDGTTNMHSITSDGLATWDVLGMAEHIRLLASHKVERS